MKDVLKILVTLIAYLGVGPVLGCMIARSAKAQRVVLGMMAFMPCLPPGRLTLMVFSIDTYRGHTKGFEANWIEVLGIALIVAKMMAPPALMTKRPLIPPGAIIYVCWCALSLLSILPSFEGEMVLMSAFKFTKVVLILAGVYHGVKNEEDFKVILRVLAWALIIHGLVALSQRYIDGRFQIKGWFEHQNSMGMWAYMAAIPLLALALWDKTTHRDSMLFLAATGFALLQIVLTVSRAGLAVMLMASVVVVIKCWLVNRSTRLFVVSIIGGAAAMLMVVKAKDTFQARLDEVEATAEKSPYDLRDILNMQSAAMLKESAFGIGWNNFAIANSRPRGAKFSQILEDWEESRGFVILEENYVNNALTESLYWLLLAETGWPGYCGFVLFQAVTIIWCLRCWRHYRGTFYGVFSFALLVTLSVCYLHGMVERILTQTKNLSFWMVLCGLIAAIEMMRRQKVPAEVSAGETSPKPRRKKPSGRGPAFPGQGHPLPAPVAKGRVWQAR